MKKIIFLSLASISTFSDLVSDANDNFPVDLSNNSLVRRFLKKKRCMKPSIFTLLTVCLLVSACSIKDKFLIVPVAKNIKVDGESEDWCVEPLIGPLIECWKHLTDDTKLYLAHDFDWLYFAFDVVDIEITYNNDSEESSVNVSDRVELFFAQDTKLEKMYYCIEIDPQGKVMDYSALHYRQFDYKWDLQAMKIATRIDNDQYFVEGAISLDQIRKLGLLSSDGKLIMGFYRGDFASSEDTNPNWWSWIDPKTNDPDFHVCTSFGSLYLSSK
jgi:hypothetical protein